MNAELMDIELLAAPMPDPGFPWFWLWLVLILLAALVVIRQVWQAPGLVLWRCQRRAARCQTDADCRKLALQIYTWLNAKQQVLPHELDVQLKQACFSNAPLQKQTLQTLIAQLKVAL